MNAPADIGAAFRAMIAHEVARWAGDLAARGLFPVTKERRLVVANFEAVSGAIAGRMRPRKKTDAGADREERALARVGARRVAP